MAKTLTLKKPVDPQKLALSLHAGFRFVDRKGRYILQMRALVWYAAPGSLGKKDYTWIDIPLVPETYGEAQA